MKKGLFKICKCAKIFRGKSAQEKPNKEGLITEKGLSGVFPKLVFQMLWDMQQGVQ